MSFVDSADDYGLGSWIRRRARATPGDIALVHGEVVMSYADLDERIGGLSSLLAERGIGPGARVAYQGPNHWVALGSLFATVALGAVWVPILEGRPDEDVDHIVGDSGASIVVAPDGVNPRGADLLTIEEADKVGRPSHPPAVAVALDDLAVLAYTSGTTGAPKGVMLTHANLTWNVLNVMSACRFGVGDRTLALAPFTRLGGLGVFVLPTLFVGGTVVIPEASRGLLETITTERITHLFSNPIPLAEIADHEDWETADLSCVEEAVVGGSMVPEALLRTYLDKGVPLRHGYGLTEASPVVTLLDRRDAVRKFGSVGKAVGLVDVAVDAAPGATGEILVRGPNVTSGYLNVGVEADPDGWWHTGDAGRLDEEGFLYVVDRMGERITVGAVSVFPAEIERSLLAGPGVSDVAVIGDGDKLVIFVVPDPRLPLDPSISEQTRGLPCDIREIDAIPRNAAGKILRDELRALR